MTVISVNVCTFQYYQANMVEPHLHLHLKFFDYGVAFIALVGDSHTCCAGNCILHLTFPLGFNVVP